jgi:hypothetical protein
MNAEFHFGDLLEAGNGVWAVLALWLSIFMAFHVLMVRVQRHIKWHRLLFNFHLPLSIQIAIGTLAVSVSIAMTRAVLWWSRYKHDGHLDLLMPESGFYLAGTVLGIVGFLCILRTVSQPVFGQWPWVGATLSAGAYVLWWVVDKFT